MLTLLQESTFSPDSILILKLRVGPTIKNNDTFVYFLSVYEVFSQISSLWDKNSIYFNHFKEEETSPKNVYGMYGRP